MKELRSHSSDKITYGMQMPIIKRLRTPPRIHTQLHNGEDRVVVRKG